ncbi:MAG TPA: DUF6152 family protein [Candidatus Saccharimonadales bacterium]|nr:DUF6152 family protein [Candidatus Saccharimonadales bacterium]
MRSGIIRFLIVAAGFGLISAPIFAHHGVTNYDMKKTIVLTGTITDFDWSNPHCLAHVDVTDDRGHTSHWTLEMASTFTMAHHGWDAGTLKRGDQIKVETHPAKNGAPVGITSGPGFALKVMVNGKELPSQ